MFKRETLVDAPLCPECGARLAQERDLLLCKEHGAFFVYGANVLVRAPGATTRATDAALPWEPRPQLA